MNVQELQAVLEEYGIRPSRRLGQNFLIDGNLLSAMIRAADISSGDRVLEVGPGTGVLTERLLDEGARVTAIECDHRLAAYLRKRFAAVAAFQLIEGDACKTDYAALFDKREFRCMSNLPYACSGVFLAGMARLANAPSDLHVLLQREMADRVAAAPGSKVYGALTVTVQLRYEVSLLRRVPPQVFMPPPKVGSAFVRLRRHSQAHSGRIRSFASRLATTAFSQRRKKSGKTLAAVVPDAARRARAFAAAELDPGARPECFSPADFIRLATCLISQ